MTFCASTANLKPNKRRSPHVDCRRNNQQYRSRERLFPRQGRPSFLKGGRRIPVLVLKNNAPLAIITSPDEYSRLIQIEEDYYLLNEALERLSKNEGVKTHSLEEVMAELGIDDKDLDSLGEVEFE